MPISATGRTNERGLTLVELLVVLLIIGMTAGLVVFSVPRGQSDLAKAALYTERAVAALRDAAVAESTVYGMEVTPRGIRRFRAAEGEWTALDTQDMPRDVALRWLPDEGWALPEHEETITLGLTNTDKDREAFRPEIIFSPEGSVTPFTVELMSGDERAALRVDGFGRIEAGDAP